MQNDKNQLIDIAREHLGIQTLEAQRSDQLDFHTVSVWAVTAALGAAMDAGRKAASAQTVDQMLAESKQIAAIWDTDDVQIQRPDLTVEQAWQVLQRVKRRHDATIGVTWEILDLHAEDMFGSAPETDEQAEAL